MKPFVLLLGLGLSASAIASVGKVVLVSESEVVRGGTGAGKGIPLSKDDAVEVGDFLRVKKGRLKIVLTDGSVMILEKGTELKISEAEFSGNERKSVKAFLQAGKIWNKVEKAMSSGTFEIETDRAVAGVRGTIFRVDADTILSATGKGKAQKVSVVSVKEGIVKVTPSKKVITASARAKKKSPKGQRHEVPGPQEVSVDAWEKKFIELQSNQTIAVGVDLWEQVKVEEDDFAKWAEANQ